MAKAILVCGKVCCGKTTYTASLQANGAVLLSSDELMRLLFDEYLGDRHDVLARRVNDYLLQKSLELLAAGVDVVLDWGFWTKEGREAVLDFYRLVFDECADCKHYRLDHLRDVCICNKQNLGV